MEMCNFVEQTNLTGFKYLTMEIRPLVLTASFIISACTAIGAAHRIPDTGVAQRDNSSAPTAAYNMYVDKEGVMRRDDTKEEVSYYGTNYTVPFAHAYRALGQLGIDRKEAIDRDVYHMARLGFNGFRLHLWDVELSDSVGNLLENEHLDLLDYLLARLEERGIRTVLTAQTNFGNGYPERNTDPYGAFTYDYEKCLVHDTEEAVKAQERYVGQLLTHRNPYTGKTYASDPMIIGVEINNEPCHSGSQKEVRRYVDRMAKAIRRTGWKKPVFYNVSHNYDVTQAFYDADIDGTTYQWYPVNLVAGHTREGNFLPYVDQYDIPWAKTAKGFDKKARIVYEFDPADNLYSYLFPAVARTFRKEGFQWITQFAYDPTDMAWGNTEYQTHYLNLAYTPRKALAMMIAAEAARTVGRGADYGKYPADTIFGDFTVSSRRDLSLLNDGRKYFYTGSNDVAPKSPADIQHLAGSGNSPVVRYEGEGAYFLDRLPDGAWRLEVMPDVILTSDPFAKPSLDKRVGEIIWRDNLIDINLPTLGKDFHYKGLNQGNDRNGHTSDGSFKVYPGVYLLAADKGALSAHSASDRLGNLTLGEYAAPAPRTFRPVVVHTPQATATKGEELTIRATVASPEAPDSVVIYPSTISFWNEHNRLYPMKRVSQYGYEATIPAADLGDNRFAYTIVAFGKDGKSVSFPPAIQGTPLDWDYPDAADLPKPHYVTRMAAANDPVVLFDTSDGADGSELSSIPTQWSGVSYEYIHNAPAGDNGMRLSLDSRDNDIRVIISKYVAPLLAGRDIREDDTICLSLGDVQARGIDQVEIAVVNRDGFTYSARVPLESGVAKVSPADMKLTNTLLSPEPYPMFLSREFIPNPSTATPLRADDIERVQLIFTQPAGSTVSASIKGIWIDRASL